MGAAFQDPPSEKATCIDIVTLYLSSAPVNIITDLAMLFLPMPILTSMRLPRNEKIILIVTFSFGGFVAVVDVIRIAYLESASLAKLQNTAGSNRMNTYNDYSWIASLSFMWSAIEVHVGMICACVPGAKPLVAKIFPNFLGRIKAVHNQQGNPRCGTGDAQWANMAPWNHDHQSTPASPGANDPGHPPTSPLSPDFQLALRNPAALRAQTATDNPSHAGEHSASNDEENMNMMDFLTTPDMTHPPLERQETHATYGGTTASRPRTPSLTILDFVNMKNPRSMVNMSNKESIFPISLVTILFFLWGFAYGLLDVLNQQFQVIVHITSSQAIGLHAAYYGAYFVAPLTFGQWVFRKYGFKATFIVGLCIYSIGTLVFWPSAVLASFPAFLISNFIIGLGVATLETAGNPFISLCGPPEHAEVRLNISQGVQAIGSVVSPILAKQVLFKNILDAPSLIDVQWTYLGIALFDVILALIFYYLPIPEASDEDLESVAERRRSNNHRKVLGLPVIYTTLIVGMFSEFCYVGGQEAVSSFFQQYITAVKPHPQISPFNYQAIGHTVFAVGRFLTAALGLCLKPRHILLLLYAGVITTSALAMSLDGYRGVGMIILILFFESGIFSLVFAIALRGLGAKTKWGAVLLTASTSGGAVIPGVMSPLETKRGVRYSFAVVVAVFSFGALMPVYLELLPAARRQVETGKGVRRGSVLGIEIREKNRVKKELERVLGVVRQRRRRMRRRRSGEESRRTSASMEIPEFKHVEAAEGAS